MEDFEITFREDAATWFNEKGSYTGMNGKYRFKEYERLYAKYNCASLLELLYRFEHGAAPLCKMCPASAKFNGSRGYNDYCSRTCSCKDHERRSASSKKASASKKENGTVVKFKTEERECLTCGVGFTVAKCMPKKYCDLHMKTCKTCDTRHHNAGACCSTACTNKLKQQTNLKKSGVTHNLQIVGNRPNTIAYYVKRGYTTEEAVIKVADRQRVDRSDNTPDQILRQGLIYTKCQNISQFLDKLEEYISTYKTFQKPMLIIERFTNASILQKYSVKALYDMLFKRNPDTVVYKIPKSIKGAYSYYYYRTQRGELLRSTNEYLFYNLLVENNIVYTLDQCYPDSLMRYDFYLPKYGTYVEIAGLMKDEKYRAKMAYKKEVFGAFILETQEDMLGFVQKMKTPNEN